MLLSCLPALLVGILLPAACDPPQGATYSGPLRRAELVLGAESGATEVRFTAVDGAQEERFATFPAGLVLGSVGHVSLREGREGEALRCLDGAVFLEAREGSLLPGPEWTVEFWVNLEGAPRRAGINLLRIPGCLTMRVQGDGRVRAVLESEPEQGIVSTQAIEPGEWTYIGFSLNAEFVHQGRLVVGSRVSGRRVGDPGLTKDATGLILGDDRKGAVGLGIDDLAVRWHACTTDELLRRAGEPLEAGYVRGTERWRSTVADKRVTAKGGWPAGELSHVVADELGLRWVPGDWTELVDEPAPMARTTHPTIYVGDHTLFIYGGETRDSNLPPMVNTDDTWLFHTDTETWERALTEKAPPPRCHQAAAFSPDHGVVFIAGGFVNEFSKHDLRGDVWLYDVSKRQWIERQPVAPLSDCGVVYHPGIQKFLIIRGRRVASYDPVQDTWELLRLRYVTQGGGESDYTPGTSVIAGLDPRTNRVLLFGGGHHGGGEVEYVDTTAILDLEAGTVTVLDLPESPSPRVRSGFAFDTKRNRFVLYGGVQGQFSEREGDLWSFDPEEPRWVRQLAANAPSPRGGYYGMAYDPELDRFYLLCGRSTPKHFLNDSWRLELDDRAEGRATFVFDRGAWTKPGAWSLEADVPDGAGLEARFRQSDDLATWSEWTGDPASAVGRPYLMVELRMTPAPGGRGPVVRSLGF